jgi:hypothetical protein
MMQNQGRHSRERFLSRLWVELMRCDHITPEQKPAPTFFLDFWDN